MVMVEMQEAGGKEEDHTERVLDGVTEDIKIDNTTEEEADDALG